MRPSGTYGEGTTGCGTEVVWLTAWMEDDHYVNSHLEAGENLPLGYCSSYPWLPRAFPSTPLTSKSPWQSSQPTSMATVTGRGLWEPHCGCLIHQPHQPQQHGDSSPMLMALWQISPAYRSDTSTTQLMTPAHPLEMRFYPATMQNKVKVVLCSLKEVVCWYILKR